MRRRFAPRGVQSTFAFLVGLRRIEVVPLIRQLVPRQVGLDFHVAEIKKRTHLERSKVFIEGHDIEARAIGFWTLRKAVIHTNGANSFIPR